MTEIAVGSRHIVPESKDRGLTNPQVWKLIKTDLKEAGEGVIQESRQQLLLHCSGLGWHGPAIFFIVFLKQ